MAQRKDKPDLPLDMWLHVASDAIRRYMAGGGEVEITEAATGLIIHLIGIAADDPRLAPGFADNVKPAAVPEGELQS